jgi:hypothetical protein
MEKLPDHGILTPTERRDILLEGWTVLRAVGGRKLAREFRLRAARLPSREELAALLLECLQRRDG